MKKLDDNQLSFIKYRCKKSSSDSFSPNFNAECKVIKVYTTHPSFNELVQFISTNKTYETPTGNDSILLSKANDSYYFMVRKYNDGIFGEVYILHSKY